MNRPLFYVVIFLMVFSSFSIAYSLEENSYNNIESFTGIENTLSQTIGENMLVSNTLGTQSSILGTGLASSSDNSINSLQEGNYGDAATTLKENSMSAIGVDSSTIGSATNLYSAYQTGGTTGLATAAIQDENVMGAVGDTLGMDSSTMGSATNLYSAYQTGGTTGLATAAMGDENVMGAVGDTLGMDSSTLGTGMAGYSSFNAIQEGNYGDAAITLLKDENIASSLGNMMGMDGGTISMGLQYVGAAEQLASGDVKGAAATAAGTTAGYYAGAAIGTAIGGPVGTVVGGMIGSYIGAESSKLMGTMMERNPTIFTENNIIAFAAGGPMGLGAYQAYEALKDPQHTMDHWNTEGNKLLDKAGLSGLSMSNLNVDISEISMPDVTISQNTVDHWKSCFGIC